MRIEWSRARARAHRWQEEALLLEEEMRRVLAFFTWKAQKWIDLAVSVQEEVLEAQESTFSTEVQRQIHSGKIAHAKQQASLYKAMGEYCRTRWKGLSDKLLNLDGKDGNIMVEYVPPVRIRKNKAVPKVSS